MSSAQYSLVHPGQGLLSKGPLGGLDTYRSPFSPSGQGHFVWSERHTPLAHILKDNTLPVVVKISEEAKVRAEGDSCIDFRQPLLLYRQQQTSRLYARSVTSSGKDVGPFVVVPYNYPGLFRPCDKAGCPLTSVATVARLMPVSILSCTRCEGYLCVSPIQDDVTYQKTSLEPGVYVIRDIVEEVISIHVGGPKGRRTKLVRCLRCVNESGVEVLFPLKASGQFYVTTVHPRHTTTRHAAVDEAAWVYGWPELVQLPGGHPGKEDTVDCEMTAKLMYGKPPPQDCDFTGTLAFKHVTKESTVIGCTTSEATPRLLELSLHTKGPDFVLALNQDCFHGNSPVPRCLKFLRQELDKYVTEMKVRRDYEVDSAEIRESAT